MVTRVDRKPIIYNTTLIRILKPAASTQRKALLDDILGKVTGSKPLRASARDIMDDVEDIQYAYDLFGLDDPLYEVYADTGMDMDDEAVRVARLCINTDLSGIRARRAVSMNETACSVQKLILEGVESIYCGTEAVYKLLDACWSDNVFVDLDQPHYVKWAKEAASHCMIMQAPYLLLHPTAVERVAKGHTIDMNHTIIRAWTMFKKIETLCIRLASRKNLFAHAHHSGIAKRNFEPSPRVSDDFRLPATGFCEVTSAVSVYYLMGVKYFKVGDALFALSVDDCVNISTMAQCYFRTAMYFTPSNGYKATDCTKALKLLKDICNHCCRLIDAGKNFSHVIRSMHILAQGDFNDIFEEEQGTDLGWRERSENYTKESKSLDPMGAVFHKRALELAQSDIDKLNVGFIYHAFVGDEMVIDDLREKVRTMKGKVRKADDATWNDFLRFSSTYMLCRFLKTNKKRPKVGGEVGLLNNDWATRCLNGHFTMPPHAEWGRVYIKGEYTWTRFADTWHLDAQDVAYVPRDSKGLKDGKYRRDQAMNSELLMAMQCGELLDTLTGSTPKSARDRICKGDPIKEVVLTTAPKAENAKPSWKKRVTFAADCEFRKMQAEYDRNCRKVMNFVRGPSLGVDQTTLEGQFAHICEATTLGTAGCVCSHDISAWSESMDRDRKFEFEEILTRMMVRPNMKNIKSDWAKINATVLKQGCKDIVALDNGSFQGFDGSASTILHAMILIYCIDTARRQDILDHSVKTDMATLIDDCVALMTDLHRQDSAKKFWSHLKGTYMKLGFEVDDLKSIFSNIKAIYLSRRFLTGGEVPADLKVYIKAHCSYEDPLRCSTDVASDIMGALRGACDANGDPWYIYYTGVLTCFMEIAHHNPTIVGIPAPAACVFALAPSVENGWAFPSIISWTTNEIVDKRSHFNSIMESAAEHKCTPADFQRNVDVFPRSAEQAYWALKSQAWRIVSYASIFTSPFDAIREGPLKPDMLKRNYVQDMLSEIATAEPWKSLLKWSNSETTTKVRELLVSSGPLHAPTLSALVNCMPDNYRLSLVGKAIGSKSLLSMLPKGNLAILKRRVHRCAARFFEYSKAIYAASKVRYDAGDISSLTYIERTKLEREEFYTANGVVMIDHTFPDAVGTFTVTDMNTRAVISPNMANIRIWDKRRNHAHRVSELVSNRGIYIPRRSNRVWEITSEYAKGWDTVSQRVAMGLAIIARAEADGHRASGLLSYFIKSWNELSNITPDDTHLISIHGSIKRLDANPGSSTHPVTISRNILTGFNNNIVAATNAIPEEANKLTGSSSNLHDHLSHNVAMLAVTALQFNVFQFLGVADHTHHHKIAVRQSCVVPESELRMTTDLVAHRIDLEILDGAGDYGLLQSCSSLAAEIAIPTMASGWVMMINALLTSDFATCEDLRLKATSTPVDVLLDALARDETHYSAVVVLAESPALRGSYDNRSHYKFSVRPTDQPSRDQGDAYTVPVKTIASKFSRQLTADKPAHVAAAVAIKSIVWDRLRTSSMGALAKIYYEDPDADFTCVSKCAKSEFWKGIITEIKRISAGKSLSELTMSGFRALGVAGLHINASEDPKEVCQSVSSYFGAHLRAVVNIVAQEVCSVAGRSPGDFTRPLLERVVTNNPAVLNVKLKREHMAHLIRWNKEDLGMRIKRLEDGNPTHRGDCKASKYDREGRLIHLRCRKIVYQCTTTNDQGLAQINEEEMGLIIHGHALRAAERVGKSENDIPDPAVDFTGILAFMDEVDACLAGHNSGWNASAGSSGASIAYDTIITDSEHIASTKFAISASEIAPKLHRRMIVTKEHIPEPKESTSDEVIGFAVEDEGEVFMSIEDIMNRGFAGNTRLPIEAWKGLYTLILVGAYSANDVNEKTGLDIPQGVGPGALREYHLEEYDDDEIYAAFPTLAGDYVAHACVFNEEWLERDEAHAYMVDEVGGRIGGSLF